MVARRSVQDFPGAKPLGDGEHHNLHFRTSACRQSISPSARGSIPLRITEDDRKRMGKSTTASHPSCRPGSSGSECLCGHGAARRHWPCQLLTEGDGHVPYSRGARGGVSWILTGSGVETVAHARENGRIVFMFCAFNGPPRIVRLHGTCEVLLAGSPEHESLAPLFPVIPWSPRELLWCALGRVSESCGYAVPQSPSYVGDRDTLVRWSDAKGPDGLKR